MIQCLELSTALGLSHDETFLALLDHSVPICPHKKAIREEEIDLKSGLYLAGLEKNDHLYQLY